MNRAMMFRNKDTGYGWMSQLFLGVVRLNARLPSQKWHQLRRSCVDVQNVILMLRLSHTRMIILVMRGTGFLGSKAFASGGSLLLMDLLSWCNKNYCASFGI